MLEEFIQENFPNKMIYLIINKIDLIPDAILREWIQYFKKTTSYQVFGVSALYKRGIIYFKKQLSRILAHGSYKAIIAGYPNTGKSSLINALSRNREPAPTSSRAGWTREVTEIKISPKIVLFDSPGVIPLSEYDETDQVIKSFISPEKVEYKDLAVFKIIDLFVPPKLLLEYFEIDQDYIKSQLEPDEVDAFINRIYIENQLFHEGNSLKIKIKQEDMSDNSFKGNLNYNDFQNIIKLIGSKKALILKKGEIDENRVYLLILNAWQKNKIKYYVMPPKIDL